MTSSDKTRDTPSSSSSSATPKYSTTDRNCKTIPPAPAHRLDIEDIYSNPSDPDDKPNLDVLKQHLLLEGRLTEQAALRIIETGKEFVVCVCVCVYVFFFSIDEYLSSSYL
jgi:serine/threonine-protein phosphatase 2B catalytic subunit